MLLVEPVNHWFDKVIEVPVVHWRSLENLWQSPYCRRRPRRVHWYWYSSCWCTKHEVDSKRRYSFPRGIEEREMNTHRRHEDSSYFEQSVLTRSDQTVFLAIVGIDVTIAHHCARLRTGDLRTLPRARWTGAAKQSIDHRPTGIFLLSLTIRYNRWWFCPSVDSICLDRNKCIVEVGHIVDSVRDPRHCPSDRYNPGSNRSCRYRIPISSGWDSDRCEGNSLHIPRRSCCSDRF